MYSNLIRLPVNIAVGVFYFGMKYLKILVLKDTRSFNNISPAFSLLKFL